MISAGYNIKSNTEPLRRVPVQHISDTIRNPQPEIASLIGQLRVVRKLDNTQYSALKVRLPYFVCGIFNPSFRNTENFAYTEYFIIDIDHLAEKQLSPSELKKKLSQDSRVMMCFVSPSGDGIKVLFKLEERCYDVGIYKIFYKLFLTQFSQQYKLEQVVDGKTCDVTRACFLSMDVDIYFNPNPEPVKINTFIDVGNNIQSVFDKKREAEQAIQKASEETNKLSLAEPGQNILTQIKQLLDAGRQTSRKTQAPVYVPEELVQITQKLLTALSQQGIKVIEERNIQYGKKLRLKVGTKQAEINIFFGKKGFSVVQSPRTGTDPEANEVMAQFIESFILENY